VLDVNAHVGELLRDLAFVQTSKQKQFGYKRASAAVLSLEEQLPALLRPNRTLDKISGVGPASTRIILEVLETGGSATVERAVEESGQAADIERRRGLRGNFLSRAEVLRVLRDPTLKGPTLKDYHGDLQMHSEWSDGVPTLAEIADACMARGYAFAAVTDHSHGLKIAGGISMEDAARQHDEIDALNRTLNGTFRLIKGIEANIGANGDLDLSGAEAERFELVLAAPHSRLRVTDDQTARLVRAVQLPKVKILAHPRGRMSGSRAGVAANWDKVFAAARAANVAVELDGDPSRQDLDHELATRARKAGCLFALDSDAHTTSQLRYAETAIAHARLAGIPKDRIVNCWPTARLMKWIAEG
jgi:histidinol phosphatase-like PHP family hydrolase